MIFFINLTIFIVAGDFDPTTRVESLGYDRQEEKRKTKKAVDEDLKDI